MNLREYKSAIDVQNEKMIMECLHSNKMVPFLKDL